MCNKEMQQVAKILISYIYICTCLSWLQNIDHSRWNTLKDMINPECKRHLNYVSLCFCYIFVRVNFLADWPLETRALCDLHILNYWELPRCNSVKCRGFFVSSSYKCGLNFKPLAFPCKLLQTVANAWRAMQGEI